MKENDSCAIINLFINDSLFRAMITPAMMAQATAIITDNISCQIVQPKWCLTYVKLKDDFSDYYKNIGYKSLAFHQTCLAFMLILCCGADSFIALYVPYSGKIVILPRGVVDCKRQFLYSFCQKQGIEKNFNDNSIIKQRSMVGIGNFLFFIRDIAEEYENKDGSGRLISKLSCYQFR